MELFHPDWRYGKTVNRLIIDEGVQEGIPWLEVKPEWGQVLVDLDNLSGSTNTVPGEAEGSADGLLGPRLDPPLHLVRRTFGTEDGLTGLVIPLLDEEEGSHGFPPPGMVGIDFDVGQFMEHQIGHFFATRGTEVRYDTCMETLSDCDFIEDPPPEP